MLIREDELTGPAIAALLQYHLAEMHQNSPPDSVFAFDIDRLRAPDVTFWSAWDDRELLGCAALKELAPHHGEIKSMRTAPNHMRKGVAAALLDSVIEVAQVRGYRRLSLETGSGPAFDPALSLYRKRGFVEGMVFAGYTCSNFNRFFHIDLAHG